MEPEKQKPNILIALPARNEADTIRQVIASVKEATSNLTLYSFDIVVLDDASHDRTRQYASEVDIPVYSLPRSHGLGHAFSHIIRIFTDGGYTHLVTIDADGQFNAGEIPRLIEPLISNRADFVTGSRFLPTSNTANISFIKRAGNRIGAWYISSILKQRFYDVTCGFRAYTREAILRLHTFSDFTYTQEVFLNLGIKKMQIVEVPITTTYFNDRKSKMVKTVLSYIIKSLKIIIKSIIIYAPMRLFGVLGNMSFLVAVVSGLFVIAWDQATGSATPYKWVAIISITTASLGVLLYCAGILLQVTSRLQLTLEENLYLSKRRKSE